MPLRKPCKGGTVILIPLERDLERPRRMKLKMVVLMLLFLALSGCSSVRTVYVDRPVPVIIETPVPVIIPIPLPCDRPELPEEPPTWLESLELLADRDSLLASCSDKLEAVRERMAKEKGAS